MDVYEKLDELSNRIGLVCRNRKWDKGWSKGGCYLHLEASEFIESLRGKGDDSPAKEAGDIIMALFSILDNYNIKPSDVFQIVEEEILPGLE